MKEVLLVGNPNTGKTTLFNSLTFSDEHVGNWHGVTVDTKKKPFQFGGEDYLLVDTPGLYSLSPLSFEEQVAAEAIKAHGGKIINICDKNNLGRNLYLTLCLLEEGCDVVLAINEIDRKTIIKPDIKKLSDALGIDVVLINAEKKTNLDELKECLSHPKRKSKKFYDQVEDFEQMSKIRYDFVDKILSSCTAKTTSIYGASKLDKIFLNKFLAFPMFLGILALIFYLTFFSLGAFLSDVLGSALDLVTSPIARFLEANFANSWVTDLVESAIFGGVGTVLSFLPQVVLLFFFLSILEDSGYMSRIAFIFEDILGKIGLSGKSVYTLLMGFGCSTSAIMTSRNMDDKNAKIKTAILCPYMSCSAKIPIYTVLGGAFFGAKNLLVIIGLYLLGVVVAICISKVLDMTVLKSKKQSFILEFPPYRVSSPKRIWRIIAKNTKDFALRVGSIMVAMNVIIWTLSSFNFSFQYVSLGGGSILETIGKLLAPIFSPLGFGNWAIVCCLLAGLVAKEVVVSSIAMFNHVEASAYKLISRSILLSTSLVYFSSASSVLSFLVFCLLYTPCIASISMLLQEIGKKWTLIAIIIQLLSAYLVSFLVYQIAFAVEIFGFLPVLLCVAAILFVAFCLLFVLRSIKRKRLCQNCSQCDKNCQKREK